MFVCIRVRTRACTVRYIHTKHTRLHVSISVRFFFEFHLEDSVVVDFADFGCGFQVGDIPVYVCGWVGEICVCVCARARTRAPMPAGVPP